MVWGIRGAAYPGGVLIADTPYHDPGNGRVVIYYQWYRDGVAMEGQNSDRYLVQTSDLGFAISVRASIRHG